MEYIKKNKNQVITLLAAILLSLGVGFFAGRLYQTKFHRPNFPGERNFPREFQRGQQARPFDPNRDSSQPQSTPPKD